MRTTIDIDDPILRDLKRMQREQGKSLGRLVSDLLAIGIAQSRGGVAESKPFAWESTDMSARVELRDKDAVLDLMEENHADTPE